MSLYTKATTTTTTSSSTSSSPASTPTDDGFGFKDLGCYTDSTTSPALSYNAGFSPEHSKGWEQITCRERCMAKNFQYYGLESGGQCFCGDGINQSANSGQQVSKSECNTPCNNDPSLTCGGTNR